MSWRDRLENIEFTIITGDGKVFKPLWRAGEKIKRYNISNYNFISVKGSFSDRKQAQSGRYPLVFWFQGDDNIEQANRFELSADDPRPWTVKHPFYGNITGQPISIRRNDTSYNTTEVTVSFWESISKDYPNAKVAIEDSIISKVNIIAGETASAYAAKVNPKAIDQQIILNDITQVSSAFNDLLDNENFAEYQNVIAQANSATSALIGAPESAMSSVQEITLTPSLFSKPVRDRINAFKNAFSKSKETLQEFNDVNTKLYFESSAATCISGMCQASATPIDGDYVTREDIEKINSDIVSTYEEYLQILNDSQVEITNVSNTYFPAAVPQRQLHELIVETNGNLFIAAFQAKQQRIVETKRDSNLFLLAHRYVGLDANDVNLEEFRQLNNIKSAELFNVKKGREIKYFK